MVFNFASLAACWLLWRVNSSESMICEETMGLAALSRRAVNMIRFMWLCGVRASMSGLESGCSSQDKFPYLMEE